MYGTDTVTLTAYSFSRNYKYVQLMERLTVESLIEMQVPQLGTCVYI